MNNPRPFLFKTKEKRGQRQSHWHPSLQVAHLSIGGNLSLCLAELNAAMQRCSLGSCSPTLPASEMWGGRREGGVGRAPHSHRQQIQRTGFLLAWERMSHLKPSIFPSCSHSQACFSAENNENFLPRGGLFVPFESSSPSPIFSGNGMS